MSSREGGSSSACNSVHAHLASILEWFCLVRQRGAQLFIVLVCVVLSSFGSGAASFPLSLGSTSGRPPPVRAVSFPIGAASACIATWASSATNPMIAPVPVSTRCVCAVCGTLPARLLHAAGLHQRLLQFSAAHLYAFKNFVQFSSQAWQLARLSVCGDRNWPNGVVYCNALHYISLLSSPLQLSYIIAVPVRLESW